MAKFEKTKQLDAVNKDRVEKSRGRVAHAINLIYADIEIMQEEREAPDAIEHASHAMNLLEAAHEDMAFACSYFEWDTGINTLIESACAKLGIMLSVLVCKEKDIQQEAIDDDLESYAGIYGNDALSTLGMVLATLNRWFDDQADVSEV